MLIAALSFLACALILAPIGATQSSQSTLSRTPPVPLAPASTTTTTSAQPGKLPRTGIDLSLVAVLGGGLLGLGAGLRRTVPRRASPRSW